MASKRSLRSKNTETRPEPVKAGDSQNVTQSHSAAQFPGELGAKIHTIRGVQVMLDSDLAELYGVEAKRINEQVRRNPERFPAEFCFPTTPDEAKILRSQIATLSFQYGTLRSEAWGRHRKYLPHVFTEQGIAMLSAVLRSPTAVRVSIHIMQAFVEMRRAFHASAGLIQRLDGVERRQVAFETETDRRFEQVFTALEGPQALPKQGVFYDGQIHDAHAFASDLIRSAKKSIVLIDNYVDDSVLTVLAKRNPKVTAVIYTRTISQTLSLDLQRHNAQYPAIQVREFQDAHDRFLILDDTAFYHIGASLKDLGKKWFAFSRFEKGVAEMLGRLG